MDHVVDDPRYAGGDVNGIPIHVLAELTPKEDEAFVVAVGDASLRRRAASALAEKGFFPIALVHPSAVVVPTAAIGPGSLICAGAVISDRASVGRFCIVNIGSTLSHDVYLGDFVTVSPGSHLAGHIRIEDYAYIGVGASIINGTPERELRIGRGAMIAAGATVIADVADNTTVGGVPAKPLHTPKPR